jgi:GTP cyclohydrolase I
MKMRGVKQQNSKMITSAISGVFKDKNNGARAEFLQLIK